MASAITAARQRINDVGADGDLDGAAAHGEIDLDIESIADSIELPEGKVIYPPKLHGEPIDRVACALLDMQQPSRSRFLRLVGPPGTGTSQSGRAIAYRLWTSAVGRSRRAAARRSTASPRCRADRPRTSSRSAPRAGREVPHDARGCA
jgi:hypothetical protein